MARVDEIAARETQNVLNEFNNLVLDVITAERMKEILSAFKDSGNEFFKLESFGVFLKDYVIDGTDIIQVENGLIHMEDGLISFDNFLWNINIQNVSLPPGDGNYFLVFDPVEGKYKTSISPPDTQFKLYSFTMVSQQLQNLIDLRGEIGGVRFKYDLIIDGGEW